MPGESGGGQTVDLDELGTVLVVDSSPVGRALVARLLRPYARRTIEVGSAAEARERLSSPDLSLVTIDVSDDRSFSLLEYISGLEEKPSMLVVTANPTVEEEARVSLLGAIAYVEKPVSLREILRALRFTEVSFKPARKRAYTEPLARVVVIDPDTKVAQVTWDVWDLSSSGALIGCQCFLPVGTRLQLLLVLDEEEVPIDAEVIRTQEPTWGLVSGAGAVFHYHSEAGRLSVERFVSDKLTDA